MLTKAWENLATYCARIVLTLLVVGLSACNGGGVGGGGGGSGSGGSNPGAPTDITGRMPYATSVGTGDSYYVVTGLTPNSVYAIHAYDVSSDIALYGYVEPDFLFPLCSSDRPGTADEACSTVADPDGKVYIRVSGANSGGGASFKLTVMATVTQGTSAAPLDVTASLPFAGSVLTTGSYYVVTGLTPGQRYTLALGDLIYNPDLYVYQHKAFDYPVCTSANAAWTDEACAVAANFEGKLYVKVDADNGLSLSQLGAHYTISVTPASGTELIFEGYSDAPVDLTGMLPYAGQVNRRPSYYTIGGLTPDTRYEIRMDNPSADVPLWVFPGGQFSGSLCTVGSYATLPARKSCVAQASASGTLNVEVPNSSTEATYTLDAVLAPVAEGSAASPKAITVPYDGQVDNTASYYVINGLTPDWNYTVVLSNATNNVTVSAGPSTAELGSAIGRADLGGSLFIKVDGSSTNGNGAWFTLDLTAANNPEGTLAAPVDITSSSPASPHAGQVDNRTSYYRIDSLTAGSYHMAHISDNTDSVQVYVWDNSAYSGTAKCWFTASPYSSSGDNHCLAPVPAGGSLYISVHGPSSISGTQYKLWMAPSLLKSEGQGTPIPVTVSTPLAGMVSNYATDRYSYYVVSGLPASASYNVALSNTTDDVDLHVFSDTSYGDAAELCRSRNSGLHDESCVATTVAGGGASNKTLYIRIAAAGYPVTTYDGASYTLTVTGGATPIANEGTAGAPIDITASLPYSGQVRAEVGAAQYSYYKVTGLDPASRYAVVFRNPSAPIDLYVYSDAAFSTNLCTRTTIVGPMNGACAALPNATGELYFKTRGKYLADSTYTLDVVAAPVATGAPGAPTDITGGLPLAGQVDSNKSYYMVGGLAAGADYGVSLSKLTHTGRAAIYSDSGFTTYQRQSLAEDNATAVAGTTDGSGILYFVADGFYTNTSGAFFDLNVRPAPQSEGSIATPIVVTLQTPYAGQKAYQSTTTSRYKISGLVPHSSHRVSLRNRSARVSVRVFDSASFTRALCFGSSGDFRTGCAAAANHAGEMFIEVGDVNYEGGFYDIYVP